MLRGAAALATVFLCFVLVLAKKDSRLCSRDVFRRVDTITTKAPTLKWLDTRLYTPSAADRQQKCIVSILTCFAAEVEVLFKEWEKVGQRVRSDVDKMLQSLATVINETQSPESTCRQCELLQEQNVQMFLSELLATLQYVRSRFCI